MRVNACIAGACYLRTWRRSTVRCRLCRRWAQCRPRPGGWSTCRWLALAPLLPRRPSACGRRRQHSTSAVPWRTRTTGSEDARSRTDETVPRGNPTTSAGSVVRGRSLLTKGSSGCRIQWSPSRGWLGNRRSSRRRPRTQKSTWQRSELCQETDNSPSASALIRSVHNRWTAAKYVYDNDDDNSVYFTLVTSNSRIGKYGTVHSCRIMYQNNSI